jgi:multidrug efflux system outer membrane protein
MRRLAAACVALALLAGCAVGPDYKQPPLTVPDQFRDIQGPPTPAPSLADQPWWDVFGDPVLKRLIDEALAGNYDMRIAAWRVDEFRANAGIARSEFFPQINIGGGFARGRTSIYLPPNSTATGNLWDANVNFGWELDIWGRIRRLNESAKARYLGSEDARRGVLLSLISDVARTYFTLRELDAELVITQKTVDSFRETYDLFERKLEQGAASAVETSYAAAALGQVAAQIPEIERRIQATENQLSLLLGRNPGPIPRGESIETQPIPPDVPPGLPSELLLRRPDVRQAEEDLIAANALVGVAFANFFPRLSLTGLFGAVAPELDNFFYPAGKTWSIAASLLGPLFQGGRIRAEYGVAYAQWEQTKAAYEQVVTGAFSETTTVLYARTKIAASVNELETTVDAYREMVRLSQVRYDSGLADYFEVLYSMQLLFPAEIALARGRLDLLSDYVDIYKALGGGWNLTDPTWQSPGTEAPPPADVPEFATRPSDEADEKD